LPTTRHSGLAVTLLERGELTSGTTGRHQGLLLTGGRSAVDDPESAVECIAENRVLRRIAPGSFEENGGLFVALTDEDRDYRPRFLAGCAACGIPARELTAAEALSVEPGLNPALKAAVWVPDATMEAMRLPPRFFATARRNGAQLRPFTEVTGLLTAGRAVTGATVPVQPSPGVLLALVGRLCDLVVNRLHPAGDEDIVVPQRRLSIVGTSAWTVTDPTTWRCPTSMCRRCTVRAPSRSRPWPRPPSAPPGRRPGR
jgi:glycerol-3-phosphate dehydrogenase